MCTSQPFISATAILSASKSSSCTLFYCIEEAKMLRTLSLALSNYRTLYLTPFTSLTHPLSLVFIQLKKPFFFFLSLQLSQICKVQDLEQMQRLQQLQVKLWWCSVLDPHCFITLIVFCCFPSYVKEFFYSMLKSVSHWRGCCRRSNF